MEDTTPDVGFIHPLSKEAVMAGFESEVGNFDALKIAIPELRFLFEELFYTETTKSFNENMKLIVPSVDIHREEAKKLDLGDPEWVRQEVYLIW